MFFRDFAFVVDVLLVKVVLELIGVQREATFNINLLQFLCMLLVELFTSQLFFLFLLTKQKIDVKMIVELTLTSFWGAYAVHSP